MENNVKKSLNKKEIDLIIKMVRKYEKYYGLYNSRNFSNTLDEMVDGILDKTEISKNKKEEVRDLLIQIYDVSDGISVIMNPSKEFNYNGIDQLTRFQY